MASLEYRLIDIPSIEVWRVGAPDTISATFKPERRTAQEWRLRLVASVKDAPL